MDLEQLYIFHRSDALEPDDKIACNKEILDVWERIGDDAESAIRDLYVDFDNVDDDELVVTVWRLMYHLTEWLRAYDEETGTDSRELGLSVLFDEMSKEGMR